MSRRILAVVTDLFFATRIRTTARHVGVTVDESPADAAFERCRACPPDLVLVDLHGPGDPVGLIAALKGEPQFAAIKVVAYCEHIDAPLKEAAAKAGADVVLPRSAFTVKLAEILAGGDEAVRERYTPPGAADT